MLKPSALCLLAALLFAPALFAQDAAPAGAADTQGAAGGAASGAAASGAGDEGDFFGTAPVEAPKGTADKQNLLEDVEKEHVGLSGILQATGTYNLTRDFVLNGAAIESNPFSGMLTGDFLVDVRLKKSFRAFIDLDVGYVNGGTPVPISFTTTSPIAAPPGVIPPGTLISATQSQTTLLGVREFFVDFNAANTVYFRAGKQVLQWGTGYFWNPTDLINIEHKSFTNLTALLDGVFGLRTDVVFSRGAHLYTFLNLNGITDSYGVAFAARTEFLVGTFEFGFSGWVKPDKIPVFGTDLTTPLFWNINLTGEASFSWGDNQNKMDVNGDTYSIRDRLVPKVDIGLSRSFDAGNVQDRIMVNAEFFYNDSGYDQNMLQTLGSKPDPSKLALATFLTGGYFQPGYYGKLYGALFVTINQFIIHDMTLSLSGLGNFSDLTGIALAMLTYSPVNNFELSLQVGGYILGMFNGEYTIAPNPSTGALGANMFFASLGAKVSF